MSSDARICFPGVGTTFVILAVGFGAGRCKKIRENMLNFRTACSCASDTACVRRTCAAAAAAPTPTAGDYCYSVS